MRVDLQLNPATMPWPLVQAAAASAERAGFSTVWVWDHLSAAALGGEWMWECFTLLGALASTTSTVGIGPLVANVQNRHPVVLANAAATVDAISGGRLTLGLGAGAGPTSRFAGEHHAAGIPLGPTLAARHRRLEETLDLLELIWADEPPDRFAGFPRPSGPVPVIVGVNSVQLAAIAGRRTNGVNVRADHPQLELVLEAAQAARAERTAQAARAERTAQAAGPELGPWSVSVWAFWDEDLLRADHPARARLAALGVDRLVLVWSAATTLAGVQAAARWLGPPPPAH